MQTSLAQAVADDINEQVERAIYGYEQALKVPDAQVEAYINLICLYWQCVDFGFASYHKLSDSFDQVWDKCFALLSEAEQLFPRHGELLFWRHYIVWAELNEAFHYEECLALAQMPNASLVPYFRIYSPPNPEYEAQARELLRICEAQPTAKNRYIISVLRKKLSSLRQLSRAKGRQGAA